MQNKFPTIAIGCLVQWYEHNIFEEYVSSLSKAINNYDGKVIIDFVFNMNQDLEKCSKSPGEISTKLLSLMHQYVLNYSLDVNYRVNIDDIYTVADYRYDFNQKYSELSDVLMWGETDMVVPSQTFISIAKLYHEKYDIDPNFIAFWGGAVMWDKSWDVLTFSKFQGKPFIEGDTKNYWSLRYKMSYDEMEEWNKDYQYSYYKMNTPQFNGCGLVISSDVIKNGLNVPKDYAFFVSEDTGFMMLCRHHNLNQYLFKDLLLVHNRKHPDKRSDILGEELVKDKTDLGKLRACHQWYKIANEYSNKNLQHLFDPNYKPLGWKDVFDAN